MSTRSKKSPPVAHRPHHVLLASAKHPPPPLRGPYEFTPQLPTGGLSSIVAAVMMEDKNKSLPPPPVNRPEKLTCREFYESKGRNPKLLFVFLMGSSPREDIGLHVPFSLDHVPFVRHKRECKPSSKMMQMEVLRRAAWADVSRMPRPAQWSTEKLQEALVLQYPPKFTEMDKAFLKAACEDLYHQIVQKDTMQHEKRQWKISDDAPRDDDNNDDHNDDEGGWNSFKAVLRMYHTLADLRESFLVRLHQTSGRYALVRDPLIWKKAAMRYNDKRWVPSSIAIARLTGFEQPIALPLNVQDVTEEELIGIAASIRPKLVALVQEWNKSFNPPEMVKVDNITEQYDYAGFPNRLESRPGVEDHVMYLWEFANESQMLGSWMFPIALKKPTQDMLLYLAERDQGLTKERVAEKSKVGQPVDSGGSKVTVPSKKVPRAKAKIHIPVIPGENPMLSQGQNVMLQPGQQAYVQDERLTQDHGNKMMNQELQGERPRQYHRGVQQIDDNHVEPNITNMEKVDVQGMLKPEHFAAAQDIALQHIRMYNAM